MARDERIHAVAKGERDQGQPKEGDAARAHQARSAVELALDGGRHPALDLFRGLAGVLGDHLHLRVRGIRERFDGQVLVGVGAPHREDGCHDEGKQPRADR